MRGILQKVKYARLLVENETAILEIKQGICVFVGISEYDVERDVEYMVKRILGVRVFDHGDAMWKKSVTDCSNEVLIVPQVELLKDMLPNSNISTPLPMAKEKAKIMYDSLIDKLYKSYDPKKIFTGSFEGSYSISLLNDGPVTLLLESRKKS
ncbi:D-tyrosyl-tRNA(Tyr) deacylase [Smittium culicis]|uniref:D-aminoacyl-tRNA deacylase n=1 Tax=Smittium culicis TaxID=133412 RepID=A0A1R1XDN3_9FUNG|nr:D-tyrosyl-tRNA(Tyr) deacylase [Smittium culicis]